MDYIDKNSSIMQWFGIYDINKDALMIKLKFEIILKAGLPEFLSKYSKNWVKFKFKRKKLKIYLKIFQM